MAKIQITLDATKLRSLVQKRNYTNKEGQPVELQEIRLEVVELKEPKTTFTKDNMTINKTHFVVALQTKEEREKKTPPFYVGEGFTTVWLQDVQVVDAEVIEDADPF